MIIRDENNYSHIWNHAIRQDRRVKLVVSILKSFLSPPLKYQILELGAGQGLLGRALAREGFSIHAVEKSPVLYSCYLATQPSIHLKCYQDEALSFLQANFETPYRAIVGIGILHHIWHDPSWAKKLYQASSADGIIVFLEPNPHNPIARWIFNTKFGRCVFKLDPQEKLKSIQDIKGELLSAGWKNLQMIFRDLYYPFIPSTLQKLVEGIESILPSFLSKYLTQSVLIIATKSSNVTN
jgi:2-polyprenyl-3-methyl-5-hydroxy-6-metoxy-1,4-benzoquinol methylase